MFTRLLRILGAAALLPFLACVAAGAHEPHSHAPPWLAATDWPDRIVTNVTSDPTTSFAVTWRTDNTVGRTIAQIVTASADARFELAAETVRAETEALDLTRFVTSEGEREYLENAALGVTHHHSAVFDKLHADTLYAFRVQGARGNWSEWIQFRTAPRTGPVTFIYNGDSQQGVRTHWARVIRMAYQVAPHAGFFLHAGDLVQQGPSDHDWAGWFAAGGFLHAQVATLPVLGNHEHMRVFTDGGRGARVPSPIWRAQFTLPIEKDLPERLHEHVYDGRYSEDLHVFALDSTPSKFNEDGGWKTQADWLKRSLAASDAHWKVVTMHHPYFFPLELGGRAEAVGALRDAFDPVVSAGDVDLVLTGHIHFYSRASELAETPGATGGRAMTGNPRDVGTMFVISAAAASQGDVVSPEQLAAIGDGEADAEGLSVDRVAENTPMFQVIDVDGDQLDLRAYTAVGDLYDAFTLRKLEGDARTVLTDGQAANGDTRLFEQNTGPYREWYDLR